jgi:hypothetical protein
MDDAAEVERIFQAVADRLGDDAFEPEKLASQPRGVRTLMTTRIVEDTVDNGGWPSVFYNSVEGHLDGAIAGYEVLGRADRAALAAEARDHGFDSDAEDTDFWDGLDARWFALPSTDSARAAWLRSHPEDFSDIRG